MAKILLVEDDNNLREIYEARLQAEGYEIVTAPDGETALVVAKKELPDLVVSDVMMPRISGFEMLDILRNTEGLKHVKVIMLTALGQAEDKTRADSLGADKYLVKSQVTLEDIVKAASELLGGETPAPAAPAAAAAPDANATAPATAPATPAPAPAAPAAPTTPPATTSASTTVGSPATTAPTAPAADPATTAPAAAAPATTPPVAAPTPAPAAPTTTPAATAVPPVPTMPPEPAATPTPTAPPTDTTTPSTPATPAVPDLTQATPAPATPAQPTPTAPPAPADPAPATTTNDGQLANAVNDLINGTPEAKAAAEATRAPQAEDENTRTKKVIQPLAPSGEATPATTDLHDLMAKEGHSLEETPAAIQSVPLPHQPGHVITPNSHAPTTPTAPATAPDLTAPQQPPTPPAEDHSKFSL